MTEIPIVFEDDFLLVIDKPPGITVNRSENDKSGTIQDYSEKALNISKQNTELNSDFINRAGIVHRLDKETSGLLIIAKNEAVFINLQKQFKERTVEKKYCALVHGNIEQQSLYIKAPVGRLPWARRKFGVYALGRDAETHLEVKQYFKNQTDRYTLVYASPKTGRTHQIRIHLKHIQHPVVSDFLYAGRKTYARDKEFCPRLFLHAMTIKFVHPGTLKVVKIESKLPDDLESVLKSLKGD